MFVFSQFAHSTWRWRAQISLWILPFASVLIPFQPGMGQPSTVASQDVAQVLNQTLDWYRRLVVERQIATEPGDTMILSNNRRIADQVVRLAFDFARTQAELIDKQPSSNGGATPADSAARYQALLQKLDKEIQESQVELDQLRQKLESARGRKRSDLQAAIAETQSEVELASARRDSLRNFADFASGTGANGLGATGLRGQVEALARSVPAALTRASTKEEVTSPVTEEAAAVSASASSKSEPSGIWGLTSDLFNLSGKLRTLNESIRATDALNQNLKDVRTPLVNSLKEMSKRGDELANEPDSEDRSVSEQHKKELDTLTAHFKQISSSVLPMGKQSILLNLYKKNLENWRATIKVRYSAELRSLLLRLLFLAIILAVVIGAAELWRKTIFRYVHEPRRRYQFLLLRRIVLWFSVIIIIAFSFASELGSAATFAGLLTAGVAVALQNVILSVAGYFFLIGRFGIRVGDRVQIAGVTGEVVEVGLVRLHLMELASGGAEAPTGRVVAFSNSIVFQPTAGVFKQIPGTNFVWHEITLTIPAQSDFGAIEKRVTEVVEGVFADYKEDMERQHKLMETTVTSTAVRALQPKTRLRFVQSGIEVVIRFPVDLQHATEIDDRLTRELLTVIEGESKSERKGSASAAVKLRTDLSDGTSG